MAQYSDRVPAASCAFGQGLQDHGTQIDMVRMRAYRLARTQAEIRELGCTACLLFDPINIRYATGTSCHSLFMFHVPSRYALIPPEGKAILFEMGGLEHTASSTETLKEVRTARSFTYFSAGPYVEKRARKWAGEIADELSKIGGGERRLAVDRVEPAGLAALREEGVEVVDAQGILERARSIKSKDEVGCMMVAISVAEAGIARMREALAPGLTENELWSFLHQTNIAQGGEWIDARLLSSGANTNPWGKECSDKIIRAADLVAFDTDMVGPFGYCVDMSRTFHCKPGRPSAEQRRLYQSAVEQLAHNIELVRPGVTYRELAEKAWPIPEEFLKNRYMVLAHGIGLCDEYPSISHLPDWNEQGFDGVIEENMTLCVESYIGAEGGLEGVKLEDQILVTAHGCVRLSTFPLEDDLMM